MNSEERLMAATDIPDNPGAKLELLGYDSGGESWTVTTVRLVCACGLTLWADSPTAPSLTVGIPCECGRVVRIDGPITFRFD